MHPHKQEFLTVAFFTILKEHIFHIGGDAKEKEIADILISAISRPFDE